MQLDKKIYQRLSDLRDQYDPELISIWNDYATNHGEVQVTSFRDENWVYIDLDALVEWLIYNDGYRLYLGW